MLTLLVGAQDPLMQLALKADKEGLMKVIKTKYALIMTWG